ncbi:hypothetical protein ABET41_20170 [Metabacillus fastidiosus]|uniref:Uncharacterized protein n=1 Tax=Metabacillus fastidiosus TaxID=1458 RepID=A0ABU6NY08_9BACI|nr:hypothetical protein [Metabacillus fastidiosus]
MPDRDQHIRATPHFDGEKESIINDPTASASPQMGVQVNTKKEFEQGQKAFNFTPKQDEELKQFEKLMRGDKHGGLE